MRDKRLLEMEAFIIEEQSVPLEALCKKYSLSKNTIRRDLETLVKKGSIRKVYGGVAAVDVKHPLLPYEQRNNSLPEAKDAICKLAAGFVQSGDIIYIDTGTTCMQMIDYLQHTPCTILTNSLYVCMKALPYPCLDIITLPGMLKRETFSFVGTDVTTFLNLFNIRKAFMAATGVTLDSGISNASMEEYHVKHAVVSGCAENFLLADHSKFGKLSLMTYCALDNFQHLITDCAPASCYSDYCKTHKISLWIP